MKKLFTLTLAVYFAGITVYAQNSQKVTAGREGLYPSFVWFADGAEPPFVPGTVLLQEYDAFVPSSAAVMVSVERDQLKQEHYRYQQLINNVPVEGAVYVMHVRDGKVEGLNGDWVASTPSGLVKAAVINECQAQKRAMAAFGATRYKWQIPEEEAFIKQESGDPSASFRPKVELVYYSGEQPVEPAQLRLAWKVDLYAHEPLGRRIYFIDAENSAVLGVRERLHSTNASGTAVTAYSGTQSITTDLTSSSNYRLRETGRGNGINTYNLNKSTNFSLATDFLDADNYWNNVNASKDEYATDAHWGAEKTYDYFYNNFNRNSINNAGMALNSYVHYGTNYYNAGWDGSRMIYGDGNSFNGNKPLTAVDVCGHEITHGLTDFTAALNYSYESGAMNEGFSDIFGTLIEHYGKPSDANWTIGEDFSVLRSMSNPNQYGQPDTYKGTNWATGGADYGGVHTNSGVLNFWFYLLANGGSGTNDKGFSYNVSSIGLADAAAIAYRTLTAYLISTSQYINARTLSIQAATDLFGASSTQVTQVGNAWDAVNVSSGSTTPPACADNYESNENKQGAKSIAVNTDITARISSTTDKDWFKFSTTTAAPKLKVTVSNLPADYDLRLYDSKGKQLAISQNTGLTSESISYNASSLGASYYVQVYGYNGANNSNCYTLRAASSSINQLMDIQSEDQNTSNLKGDEEETSDDVIIVYPNPASDKLTLSFSAREAGYRDVRITDYVGKEILKQNVYMQAGGNVISISVATLPSGVYFLQVPDKAITKFEIAK